MLDRRIEVIVQLLRRQPAKVPSELAASINLSLSRTQHLFRKETGISLGRYIKDEKMHKAQELLETSFLSVKEIAACLGVTDGSHFNRDFKKMFGTSPGRYRARIRMDGGSSSAPQHVRC